jgi:hypothetical protein
MRSIYGHLLIVLPELSPRIFNVRSAKTDDAIGIVKLSGGEFACHGMPALRLIVKRDRRSLTAVNNRVVVRGPANRLVRWLGIGMSKFYDWRARHGKVNEHNALVPRDHWLEAWEKEAILAFHAQHPLDGYRRQSYLMSRGQ